MATEMQKSYKFDTKVQHLKYKVLREVARLAWNDRLMENVMDIPKMIVPGNTPTMRCCVYKERAILGERVKLAMGGNKQNPNVIEVIDIACDECPMGGYEVTNACRGCLAHRCEDVCRFGAITMTHQGAIIDPDKCRECGMCAQACPYNAIADARRPCVRSCPVDAISVDKKNRRASIDYSKCISCGSCTVACPFSAISDVSMITDVIEAIRDEKQEVYACFAPSIEGQFGVGHGNRAEAAGLQAALRHAMLAVAGIQKSRVSGGGWGKASTVSFQGGNV